MTLVERTLKLTDERGVKKVFICNKIGISQTDMTNFLNGRYDLKDKPKKKLKELIDSYYINLPVEV
ncbi:hypothetical protein [Paenibacillus sp. QZ-Y1]|uniref:hypothetical protein n=1 Tax=Paenibacillus sp. QZ-Y1 TaxID=3414511 RepID=UPI003F7A7A9F